MKKMIDGWTDGRVEHSVPEDDEDGHLDDLALSLSCTLFTIKTNYNSNQRRRGHHHHELAARPVLLTRASRGDAFNNIPRPIVPNHS